MGDLTVVDAELDAHVDLLEERAFASMGIDDGAAAAHDVWWRGGGEAHLLDEEEIEGACYEGRGRRNAISSRLSRVYSAGFRAGWEAWRVDSGEPTVAAVFGREGS